MEDVKVGILIMDFGLNDFWMDLFNYVKEYGEMDYVFFGMYVVVFV